MHPMTGLKLPAIPRGGARMDMSRNVLQNVQETLSPTMSAFKQSQYEHNITNLHKNIKQACKELTKRDNSVKEDLEILALERGRLAYLRDELSRRAEMVSRWEKSVKAAEFRPVTDDSELVKNQKDIDKMNALRLEIEFLRKRQFPIVSSERADLPPSSVEQVVLNPTIDTPPNERVSFASIPPQLLPEEVVVNEIAQANMPEPYPYTPAQVDHFYEQMSACVDSLWLEYATNVHQTRCLMTLPNLIRLCGDADFGVSVHDIIEVYLSFARDSSCKLIEKGTFLTLLQHLLEKLYNESNETVPPALDLTNRLFDEFLMPLYQRLGVLHRSVASKHPPLPKSPIGVRRPPKDLL